MREAVRRLFGRFWVRLLAATMTSALVSVTAVGLLTQYLAGQQVSGYIESDIESRESQLDDILVAFYEGSQPSNAPSDWTGVQNVVERMSLLTGERLVVSDSQGVIIADSKNTRIGQREDRAWLRPVALESQGERIGTLYINPTVPETAGTQRESSFFGGFNRALLLGFLVAGVFSLIVSLVVARRLVRPLGPLVDTARRLGSGDLSARVKPVGTGDLDALAQAMNGMAEDLERLRELRRRMVADVAHELRTPLQSIVGYLEGIRDGVVQPDERTLSILLGQAEALRHLLDDLRDLSLAESGALELDAQPIQLNAQVEPVVQALAPAAEQSQVALSVHLESLPPVLADQRRVRQVLTNLIGNALRYAGPDGEVSIAGRIVGGTAPARGFRLSAANRGFVEITVADRGPGIPPDDLPYVFERFYRVDRARGRKSGGAGLGLTIARELVHAMGGSIGVRNQPLGGAEFWFRLPMYAEERQPVELM